MIILSLDLSTKSTGYAIFTDDKLTDYGCITASSTDVIKRIQKIIKELKEKIKDISIDRIIVEEVRPETGFGAGNQRTHKVLMWLQAALEFMVHDELNKTTIEYIYPSSWRAACGIKNGRGVRREQAKAADIKFVKDTYNIELTNDDIADAICIGHSQLHPDPDKGEMNWGQ